MEQPTGEHRTEQREVPSESIVKHTETGEYIDISRPPYEWVDNPSVRGIYEHYKSMPDDRKLYLVMGVIRNTETRERYAVYRPLYTESEKTAYVRPLENFEEMVSIDGLKVPRFCSLYD